MGTYQWVFHEGIRAVGASFNTSLGNVNLAGELSMRTNTPLDSDAQIGTVHVKGDLSASSIVAGADAGADGFFGTADDSAGSANGRRKGGRMIRAILRKGKIQPVDELPSHWREGQELIVEGCEPSDDPADIKEWHDELVALSAQIPAEDHERMAAALAEQDRQAKELMRREMGLD